MPAKTGHVDDDLITWVSRWWGKKAGQLVAEIAIGHCRGGAPAMVAVIPKERLEAFKDSRELCQDLEEILTEHARNYAGMVRFEIVMWSATKPLASIQVRRRGEGTAEDDQDPTAQGQLVTMMAERRKEHELTISALTRINEGLERRVGRYEELIDRLYAKYPELLDLMENLADRQVERSIRLRQAGRIEDVKDKAASTLMRFGPHLLAKFTGGTVIADETKMLAAAPHLKSIIESMSKDPDRFMQILGLMSEDERKHFLMVSEAYDQEEKEEREALSKSQTGIDVKTKNGQSTETAT